MKTTPSEPIPIELDKKRNLRLTLKGMCKFERKYGKSIFEAVTELFPEKETNGLTVEQMEALPNILWAELVHEDDSLTVEDVEAMIDLGNVVPLFTKVAEVFASALPEAEMKKASEEPNTKPKK